MARKTRSVFMQEVESIQKDIEALEANENLEGGVDGVKERIESLKSTTEDSLSNMPEGLQSGSTGEMLQERVDALEEMISSFDSIDFDFDEEAAMDEAKEEAEDEFSTEFESEEPDDIRQDYKDDPEGYDLPEGHTPEELERRVSIGVANRKKLNAEFRESEKYKNRLQEIFEEKKLERFDEILEEAQQVSYEGP